MHACSYVPPGDLPHRRQSFSVHLCSQECVRHDFEPYGKLYLTTSLGSPVVNLQPLWAISRDNASQRLDSVGQALSPANSFSASYQVASTIWTASSRERAKRFSPQASQNSCRLPFTCDKIDCAEEITGCNSSPVCLLSISWKIPHPHRRKADAPACV
jgi:hypothetical protein